MINKEKAMITRHIEGTLVNGNSQHFVLTKTGKLSLNGLAKDLNDHQLLNLSAATESNAFAMARKYWHK